VDHERLTPGTPDWEEAVREAIRKAQAVVLVASPQSRQSRYVKDELRIAELYQRPIYPLWAEGEQWIEAIPLGMGGTQYSDARGASYQQGVQALVAALYHAPAPVFAPLTQTLWRSVVRVVPHPWLLGIFVLSFLLLFLAFGLLDPTNRSDLRAGMVAVMSVLVFFTAWISGAAIAAHQRRWVWFIAMLLTLGYAVLPFSIFDREGKRAARLR
jgi:hypothetical protein